MKYVYQFVMEGLDFPIMTAVVVLSLVRIKSIFYPVMLCLFSIMLSILNSVREEVFGIYSRCFACRNKIYQSKMDQNAKYHFTNMYVRPRLTQLQLPTLTYLELKLCQTVQILYFFLKQSW